MERELMFRRINLMCIPRFFYNKVCSTYWALCGEDRRWNTRVEKPSVPHTFPSPLPRPHRPLHNVRAQMYQWHYYGAGHPQYVSVAIGGYQNGIPYYLVAGQPLW